MTKPARVREFAAGYSPLSIPRSDLIMTPSRRVVLSAVCATVVLLSAVDETAAWQKDSNSNEAANSSKSPVQIKKGAKRVRIHLMDKSIIAGELSIQQFEVKTEFGTLVVPVEKVVSITPGLDSHTKLSAKIDKLIADLGGADYKAREQAQKELLALGLPVRDIIAVHTDSDNAELKRRAGEIVQKLDEAAGDGSDDFDDDTPKNKTWVRYDIVETPGFTIAGKISPAEFQVNSKYGPLKVGLNDISRTEREFTTKQAVVARLKVPGQKLVQRGMQTSKIRVQPGDTVSVSATGTIVMTPWGSSSMSSPDGAANYGSYSDGSGGTFFGGMLLARIGGSGSMIKIGSRAKFTAKKAGVLQFGIAMQSSYIGTNYYYPGEYKLRIKVDPKK